MKPLQTVCTGAAMSSRWPAPAPNDRFCGSRALGPDRLGDELKVMFGGLTSAPLPDRMLELADALEEAFRRGELFESDGRRVS